MSIRPRRIGGSGSKRPGVKGIELSDRLAFDSYILAQEAAIEGRGVAMTIGPFATDEIKLGPAGSALSAAWFRIATHWQFACEAANRLKPKIRRFEDWLVRAGGCRPRA